MAETGRDHTEDAFLGGALRVLQPLRGFRSGLEAVLLAAAVPARAGEAVLEAGAGAGVASLCLARRVAGLMVTGLELDPETAALANRNAQRNGLAVTIETGSVAAPPKAVTARSFDHVFANPPFMEDGEALGASDEARRAARLGPAGTLAAFIAFCLRRAGPKGTVTVIHRADRLGQILGVMEGRLGAVTVFPLWPKAGVPAKRVIVQGRKSCRAPLTLRAGLVLHEADGGFTRGAEAILRHGAPLDL